MNGNEVTPGRWKTISTGRKGRGQIGELFDILGNADANPEYREIIALKVPKADAEFICSAKDHSLILQALILGLIRWEFFSNQATKGEICFNGLRYSSELDAYGCPVLHSELRNRLTDAVNQTKRLGSAEALTKPIAT
ncbi:MAG TPA: hypothetical protein VEF04_23450 [Blastocatellia bacterium]|nr:hypothetical protein [Blastocatellia bacterium]